MNRHFINMAYYRKQDYDYLLAIIDDRESMHNTWEEWFQEFMKLKLHLISQGISVKEVVVDLHDLSIYCKERNLKNNGKARSQYVRDKG